MLDDTGESRPTQTTGQGEEEMSKALEGTILLAILVTLATVIACNHKQEAPASISDTYKVVDSSMVVDKRIGRDSVTVKWRYDTTDVPFQRVNVNELKDLRLSDNEYNTLIEVLYRGAFRSGQVTKDSADMYGWLGRTVQKSVK
jgi:beta-lactamase class D